MSAHRPAGLRGAPEKGKGQTVPKRLWGRLVSFPGSAAHHQTGSRAIPRAGPNPARLAAPGRSPAPAPREQRPGCPRSETRGTESRVGPLREKGGVPASRRRRNNGASVTWAGGVAAARGRGCGGAGAAGARGVRHPGVLRPGARADPGPGRGP